MRPVDFVPLVLFPFQPASACRLPLVELLFSRRSLRLHYPLDVDACLFFSAPPAFFAFPLEMGRAGRERRQRRNAVISRWSSRHTSSGIVAYATGGCFNAPLFSSFFFLEATAQLGLGTVRDCSTAKRTVNVYCSRRFSRNSLITPPSPKSPFLPKKKKRCRDMQVPKIE